MTMENRSYILDFEQNPVIPQLFTSYDKFWVSPKTRLYSFSRFQYYAHNLDSLNKKNGMSATPLN